MNAMTEESPAPDWFTRALAAPRESGTIEVDGCPIHYLSWGEAERPGLLFVAPSGGHAHWFSHVAPMFADRFHVAAIDLSGCGDSGRRESYSRELVTQEIAAVLAHSGMLEAKAPPVVVGHSAGAQFAVRAAQAVGEHLLGVIAVDGLRYARLPQDHAIAILEGPRHLPAPAPPKVHPDLEECIARFRVTPKPLIDLGNDFIVRHIARNSFRAVPGGWVTKFDPAQGGVIDLAFELTPALKDLPCLAASVYSEHSHLTDETAGRSVSEMNEGKVTALTIPGTSHYPQIDSPLAFVATVKAIALGWHAERSRTRGAAAV
jgi:pimeloyl-ACP methyl ester carboxylesterase